MADNVVILQGREFEIGEPNTGAVLTILNVIGSVGVRAEKAAVAVSKNPTHRAVLMGLLAEMTEDDLIKLGAAVLQFPDGENGRAWLRKHGVRVAPLVRALMLNLQQSTDLIEAIQAFFDGIEPLSAMINTLAAMATGETEPSGSNG